MKQIPKKLSRHLSLIICISAYVIVGCATIKPINPDPFKEFSNSLQELRSGADAALTLNEEKNRESFINETVEKSFKPEGARAIENLLIIGAESNPFIWKMEKVPLFMMSPRFRQGVYNLNSTLIEYAELLGALAAPDLVSQSYFDSLTKDLNANLIAAVSAFDIQDMNRETGLFSVAATKIFQEYVENHRINTLQDALQKNQDNIERIALSLQKAIRLTAASLNKNYYKRSMEIALQLTPNAGGNKSARRKKVEELIALNELYVNRLSTLETLHNSYRALPSAHRELIKTIETPEINLSAIRNLYANGKRLYNLYNEINPSKPSSK